MDKPCTVKQSFNGVPAFEAMEKSTSSEVKNPHPQTLRSSLLALAGFDEFKKKTRNEPDRSTSDQHGIISHRLEPEGSEYIYALGYKGAKILAHKNWANNQRALKIEKLFKFYRMKMQKSKILSYRNLHV